MSFYFFYPLSVLGAAAVLMFLVAIAFLLAVRLGLFDGDSALMLCRLKADYFKGKVVWVTGASEGIGEALVRQLVQLGANVILSSRSKDKLTTVVESLGKPENAKIFPLDITDTDVIEKKVSSAALLFGRVDILINNAGVAQRGLNADFLLSTDRKIMEVNLFGTIALTKAVLPLMTQQGSGHIVNVASMAGRWSVPTRTIYSASKFGLLGYMDALRLELLGLGQDIPITNICPAPVATRTDVNSLVADGSRFGKTDPITVNGMKADRCAELILVATSNQLDEIWVGQPRFLESMYLYQYMPTLSICRKRGVAKAIVGRVLKMTSKS